MVYKKRTHKKFIKNTHKKLKNTKKIYGGKVNCIKYKTEGIELKTLIDFINTDVGEIEPVIYGGKIPEECFTVFNGKRHFKKENFDDYVLTFLNGYGSPRISLTDERITSTYNTRESAREWHREFHLPKGESVIHSVWDNSWVCIVYLELENCENNCGTEILYYNKKNECKNINLQVFVNEFILFRDCKMIHRIPDSIFKDKNKPIVRKLYRIYIMTDNEHENCDSRLIKHTEKIDVEKGQEKQKIEEVNYILTNFPQSKNTMFPSIRNLFGVKK
jgi:hypothetical protein